KANKLKPYEYLKYLLEEVCKHQDDTDMAFVDDLLPWSEMLPDYCKKAK
ncbi:MAG: transposase domain-containing protein, partial [Oscillospiraceae bacterium]|nr:transposase domain-containing protein [Oscillospiraceae bacterium]